ncbi:hypothetical protein [Leptospira fletcheri]|nr:hypothetical protein [Leptospira fletcheri]
MAAALQPGLLRVRGVPLIQHDPFFLPEIPSLSRALDKPCASLAGRK